MNQLVRLFQIDARIRADERPTAETLAREFEVSPRLIFKDRRKLLQLGAPLAWDEKGGGWFYREHWILPATYLSEGELLAFFLSVEIARSSGNTGLEALLKSAVAKIAGTLGEVVSVDLNALRASTTYSLSPAAQVNAGFYQKLHRAAAGRHKIKLRYFTASRGEWNERVVHPYHLHFARGEWILLAFDEGKAAVRCFNVARIQRLELLPHHFQRQLDFDANEFVRAMFSAEAGDEVFEVVVRFDEYQARYIRERQWHPDQTLEELADGGAILRFPASGLGELTRWILSYGPHAEVIGPPALRQSLGEAIEGLKKIYEKS